MLHWAWRQWLHAPLRAAAFCGVFAAALALCLLFEGIRHGIFDDLRRFPASLPADLVVIERDSGYFAMSPSRLPQLTRARAEAVVGVRQAHPLLVLPLIFDANAERSPALVVGYDTHGAPGTLCSARSGAATVSKRTPDGSRRPGRPRRGSRSWTLDSAATSRV